MNILNQILGTLPRLTYNATLRLSAQFSRRRLEKEYGPEAAKAAYRVIVKGGNRDQVDAAIRSVIERRNAERHQQELLNNPPPIHGSARWATVQECHARHLLIPLKELRDGGGIFFGFLNDEALLDESNAYQPGVAAGVYWERSEGHLLTVAPTRTGKGVAQVIPNLLHYEGSAIVIDPKGETFPVTAPVRHLYLGHDIFRLDPFGNDSDCFNPMDTVHDYDSARLLAEMLLPRTSSGTQYEYFENVDINFLSALIYYICKYLPPNERNLRTMRRVVGGSPQRQTEVFNKMVTCASDEVVNAMNIFFRQTSAAQAGTLSGIDAQTKIWDSERLRRVTSRSDFKFSDLKEQRITVYIVVPVDKLAAYAAFTRVVIGVALDELTRHPAIPKTPVLFLLDEFPVAIGDMKKLTEGFAYLAGLGIRLWLVAQNLPQLEQKCPQSFESILSEVSVKSFFGTRDIKTAEALSKSIGQRTVSFIKASTNINEGFTYSNDSGGGSSGSGMNTDVQLAGRPLLTPDEVLEFLSDKHDDGSRNSLMWIEGLSRPIRVVQVPYYVVPAFVEMIENAQREINGGA